MENGVVYPENEFVIEGYLVRTSRIGKSKMTNIVVSHPSQNNGATFVNVRMHLNDSDLRYLRSGLRVSVVGHLGNSFYLDNGNLVFKDNNDLIGDYLAINTLDDLSRLGKDDIDEDDLDDAIVEISAR